MTGFALPEDDAKKLRDLALLAYAMQAAGLLLWPAWIVGAVINYLKIGATRNTWLETHFNWQLRTFWVWLAGMVLAFILSIVKIGWLVGAAVTIWAVYRIVKGWLRLNDRKPMYDAVV
jgi:uncharacterized membrane protein